MPQIPVIDPVDIIPKPLALEDLSFETLYAAFQVQYKALWPDYDVSASELDPGATIGEAYAHLRLYDRARINDTFRATLLSHARRTDLDAIAADYGVLRRVFVPATLRTPAIVEDDDSLVYRCWTTIQSWARGGSTLGMRGIAWNLSLPDATDVDVQDFPGEGRMKCVLLARPGLDDLGRAALLARVSQGVMGRGTRLGSVYCDTILADELPLDLIIYLGVLPGFSRPAAKALAYAAVTNYFDETRRIEGLVALSRVEGDACVANVDYAHVYGMTADLQATSTQAYYLRSLVVLTDGDPEWSAAL